MPMNWEPAITFIQYNAFQSIMLAAQAISTICMLGIVLFVHIVQYPMLALVPKIGREEFERRYCDRAGIIIAPLMIIEAVTALFFTLYTPFRLTALTISGSILVALIWSITFFISVPHHQKLINAWDDAVHRRLMFSNLLRVILWALRAIVVLILTTIFISVNHNL